MTFSKYRGYLVFKKPNAKRWSIASADYVPGQRGVSTEGEKTRKETERSIDRMLDSKTVRNPVKVAPSRLHLNPSKLPQTRVEKHGPHKGNRIQVLSRPDRLGRVEIHDPRDGYVMAEHRWILAKTEPVKNPPLATHVARGECKPSAKGLKELEAKRVSFGFYGIPKGMEEHARKLSLRAREDRKFQNPRGSSHDLYWWAYSREAFADPYLYLWTLRAYKTEESAKQGERELRIRVPNSKTERTTVGRTTRPVSISELRKTALKGMPEKDRKRVGFNITHWFD